MNFFSLAISVQNAKAQMEQQRHLIQVFTYFYTGTDSIPYSAMRCQSNVTTVNYHKEKNER